MQIAVRLELGWQWAMDTQRNESLRKYRPENLLANAAGHVDLQPGDQTRWYIIDNQSVHDCPYRISGACVALAFTEKYAGTAHFRTLDHLPIDRQRHQAATRRYPQDAGTLIPFEAPTNAPSTGSELDTWTIVVRDHHGSAVIYHHLVWPVVHTARQYYPLLFGVHGPLLRKARARGINREPYLSGPRTNKGISLCNTAIKKERAVTIFLVLEYPLLPIFQVIWNVGFGNSIRCDEEQAQGDQGSHQ